CTLRSPRAAWSTPFPYTTRSRSRAVGLDVGQMTRDRIRTRARPPQLRTIYRTRMRLLRAGAEGLRAAAAGRGATARRARGWTGRRWMAARARRRQRVPRSARTGHTGGHPISTRRPDGQIHAAQALSGRAGCGERRADGPVDVRGGERARRVHERLRGETREDGRTRRRARALAVGGVGELRR